MISVEVKSSWDQSFFERFVHFKNEMHQNIPTSFPETIKDYAQYFSPGSVFENDYEWRALLIIRNQVVVGKAILCWKAHSTKANLGFIDWINDAEVAVRLIDEVERLAREASIAQIKTPVDLNFFVKYRIRCEGGGDPFYGEPIYPSYYHDLFKLTGFEVIGEWDTFRGRKLKGIIDFFGKRFRRSKKTDRSKKKERYLKTTVRCVRLHKWDEDIKIIYDLFTQAYQSMPEFESISFDQFKLIYDNFKYIINPLYSYIIELNEIPVGFCITFVDPLPILSKYQNRELNSVQKAHLLLKLKLNRGTLLFAHIGKIDGPNGEEIKGIHAQVSKRLSVISLVMKKVLITFQNVDSISRKAFSSEIHIPYAKYVLYGKNLK